MCEGLCHKCMGAKLIVVGAIFVVNEGLNSGWVKGTPGLNEWMLLGILLVLSGVMKLMKPHCGCKGAMCMCGSDAPAPKAGKKK